jgi:ABC-type transport system involved in multi-copper enzyme maturation permease subunit
VIRLIRAELVKLSTTRLFLWLGLLILALSAFVTSTTILSNDATEVATLSQQRSIVQFAAVGAIIALIVGIVLAAGEYTHGTIAHTFLVTPVRGRVVAAKLIAGAIVGVLVTAFAEVVTWVIAAAWISGKSLPFFLDDGSIVKTYLGILGAGALAAAIGVGLGAFLRRQTAAIVLALIWLLVGEPVLSIAGAQQYAPGHAVAAVAVAGSRSSELLAFWPGLLVALAYVVVLAVAGAVAVDRSDVS